MKPFQIWQQNENCLNTGFDRRARWNKLSLVLSLGITFFVVVLNIGHVPPLWDSDDLLDGSWQYSLTRLRLDNFSLGKDVFFTYGPLSQHLGPLIENGQTPTATFILINFAFTSLWIAGLSVLLRNILPLSPTGLLFVLYCAYWMSQTGVLFNFGNADKQAYGLILISYLGLYLEKQPFIKRLSFALLVALSVLLLQIKFSYGMLSWILMAVASIVFLHQLQLKFVASCMVIFFSCSYALFYLLTASLGLHVFIVQSLHIASYYSEIMAFDVWGSGLRELHYFSGIIIVLLFVCGHFLLGKARTMAASQLMGFVVTGIVFGLFIFKAAYIRADGHIWILHSTMFFGLSLFCACLNRCNSYEVTNCKRYQVLRFPLAVLFSLVLVFCFYYKNPNCTDSMLEIIRTGKGYNCEQAVVEKLRRKFPALTTALEACSKNVSWPTIFRIDSNNFHVQTSRTYQMKLEPSLNGELLAFSEGADPQIETTKTDLRLINHARLHLVFNSDHDDTGQIFFKRSGKEFSETDSRFFPINRGPNDVVMEIPSPSSLTQLRLDLGTREGKFGISKFDLQGGGSSNAVPSANHKQRISFLPWEMTLASLTKGWRLTPIPSLQLYNESQIRLPKYQVRDFLQGDKAPEVIVIGDGAIDGRNPVSEATNWLELLIQKYNVTGPYDGYLMAVRKENSDTHIKFLEERNEGPGLLLKLSVDPLDFWSRTAFELSKFFFKPPEIYVEIQFIDGANQIRTSVFRSSESQLEKGIYFSHLPLTRWLALAEEPKNLDASHIIMRVVKAEAVRGNGFRNLKVVSKVRKLEFHHVNILSQ